MKIHRSWYVYTSHFVLYLEEVKQKLPIYHGSPRQLLSSRFDMKNSASFLPGYLKEVGGCFVHCRVYSMKLLDLLKDYVQENELIGR